MSGLRADVPTDRSTAVPGCPNGVLADDLAGVVVGSLPAETARAMAEHAAGCAPCAERLRLLEWTASCVETRARLVRRPLSRLVPRPGWPRAAAALLLAAVATAAVAATWMRLAGVVGGRPQPGLTAARAARIAALDLGTAGIAPDAMILPDVCDIRPDAPSGAAGTPGTLIAYRHVRDGEVRTDVAAFGADGSVLWRTRDGAAIPSWTSVLAGRGYDLTQLRVLHTSWGAAGAGQTAAATVRHGDQHAVLLFDPWTGAERGTIWHDGLLATDAEVPPESVSPAVLPAATPAGARTLLFAGGHEGPGGSSPCLVVASADGRVLQHIVLPAAGPRPEGGSRAVGLRVNWPRPGDSSPGSVVVFTSDEADWEFPVTGGRLDVRGARITLTDAFVALFDRTSGGPGFAEVAPPGVARGAWVRSLEERVREETGGAGERLWGR